VAAVVLGVGTAAGIGSASAHWSGPGGGDGTAGSGTSAAVTLTPGVVTASLHPGSAGDVSTEARNPGSAEAVVPALELDPTQGDQGLAVDSRHPSCPASAFTFATQNGGGAGWTVPARDGAGDGELTVTLEDSLHLAMDAPNGCQGATVTVFLRAA
jgi:hypothetical protein